MIAGHGVFRTCEQVQSDTRISSSLASETGVRASLTRSSVAAAAFVFGVPFGDVAEITAYMASKIDKRGPLAKRLGQRSARQRACRGEAATRAPWLLVFPNISYG